VFINEVHGRNQRTIEICLGAPEGDGSEEFVRHSTGYNFFYRGEKRRTRARKGIRNAEEGEEPMKLSRNLNGTENHSVIKGLKSDTNLREGKVRIRGKGWGK